MSNSVNFYEFIGFKTFNIEVHELVYVRVVLIRDEKLNSKEY